MIGQLLKRNYLHGDCQTPQLPKMKKLTLSILLSIFALFPVHAQFSGGVQLAPAAPLGDFADAANFGFGIALQGRYAINSQLQTGLSLGFYNFGTEIDDFSFGVTSVTATAEYLLAADGDLMPYIGLDLGSYTFRTELGNLTASEGYFGLAPIFGVLYPITDQLFFDGSIKYSVLFAEGESLSYLPIGIGVRYAF
jgi:hypothetical protein